MSKSRKRGKFSGKFPKNQQYRQKSDLAFKRLMHEINSKNARDAVVQETSEKKD